MELARQMLTLTGRSPVILSQDVQRELTEHHLSMSWSAIRLGDWYQKSQTVTSKDGEVVHGHTDQVGKNGSVRRFSDDLTGRATVGEGKQEPSAKDRPVNLPPEPAKGGRF